MKVINTLAETKPKKAQHPEISEESQELYRIGIEWARKKYEIPDEAFLTEKDKRNFGTKEHEGATTEIIECTVQTAIKLLGRYEINSNIIIWPEKMLLILAIANSWRNANITQKRDLLMVLKAIAMGPDPIAQRYDTFSDRVRKLSEMGYAQGKNFRPSQEDSAQNRYLGKVEEYVRNHTNAKLTTELQATLKTWKNGILDPVRSRLDISPENESPVNLVVLDTTNQELLEKFGFSAIFLNFGETQRTIVLPMDLARDPGVLQHEYAHSQGNFALNGLYDGMNEAITESTVANPTEYEEQRKILTTILEKHPSWKSVLYKAYRWGFEDREDFLQRLIEVYGLEGLLMFARVTPYNEENETRYEDSRMFVSTQEALEFFR